MSRHHLSHALNLWPRESIHNPDPRHLGDYLYQLLQQIGEPILHTQILAVASCVLSNEDDLLYADFSQPLCVGQNRLG